MRGAMPKKEPVQENPILEMNNIWEGASLYV